jgi:hypothetical protein
MGLVRPKPHLIGSVLETVSGESTLGARSHDVPMREVTGRSLRDTLLEETGSLLVAVVTSFNGEMLGAVAVGRNDGFIYEEKRVLAEVAAEVQPLHPASILHIYIYIHIY